MGRPLLLLTFGIVVVVSIIQMGVNNRLHLLTERTVNYHSENQAKNITSSLMDYAIEEIRRDQDWKGATGNGYSSQNLLGGEGEVRVYDINDYLDPDTEIPPNSIPSWDIFTLLVYARAEYNGHVVDTEVMLSQDSYSRFSYFTDVEPGHIYFFSEDTLRGPVHTNGRFNMAGIPVFYGKITSPEDYYEHPHLYTEPQFLGGSDFNAEEIPLPTDEQLNKLRYDSEHGGLKYDNPITIELFSDGQAQIVERIEQPGPDAEIEHWINISDFNGVVSCSEDIAIKGELNGQLTVHSERNIEIMGDLTYVEDPRDYENSDDILGLVSERNVVVDDDAHSDNGSHDLEIHASIMALEKSFYVEDYNEGNPRGVLGLLGGVIQEERGPVGTFRQRRSGIIETTGYEKDYQYDERLLRMHPPSYPRQSFFTVFYWKDRLVASY